MPVLLIVNERRAFVRRLYANDELPAGTFGSNITFVQALREAVSGF